MILSFGHPSTCCESRKLACPVKETDAVTAAVGYGHRVGAHRGPRPIRVANGRGRKCRETSGLDALQEISAGHQKQVVGGLVEVCDIELRQVPWRPGRLAYEDPGRLDSRE